MNTHISSFRRTGGTIATMIVLTIAVGFAYGKYVGSTYLATSAARAPAQEQRRERTITHKPWPNAPVRILAVKSKGKDRPLNGKFEDDDDGWVKGLSLRLKNVSDKTIVHIEAELEFPRPENTDSSKEPPLVIPLFYGHRPFESEGQTAANPTNPLRPGDVVEILFPGEAHDETMIQLSKENYPSSIRHLKVDINIVVFDDETMWHAGGLMRRDPSNPKRWIRIEDPRQGRMPKRQSDISAFSYQNIAYTFLDGNNTFTNAPDKFACHPR